MSTHVPTFSICHATARLPEGWPASHDSWMANADDKARVEYILALHTDDYEKVISLTSRPIVTIQDQCYCSVDNWNAAAQASTGHIIILNADDFFPPAHWDTKLLETLRMLGYGLDDEFAIHVSTGNPDLVWDRRLMALGIISRKLYERWGYALYPEYESMDSDVDMTEHAYQDGVVIQAFDLTFEHRHPAFGKAAEDDIYRHQNRPEAYKLGHEVLERRRKDRFAK